ncbi:hypothetical protein PENTCL1PPCAC_30512, partial [Pristionchus entomophagus]
ANMISLVALLSLLALSRACPDGSWTSVDGDCFKIYDISKTYYDAEDYCVSQGGHLASIHSQNELYSLENTIGQRAPLIGLKCSSVTDCTWTDGTPYDYSNFIYGKPTLEYGSCVHLYGDDELFYSWNCATPMSAFMCRIANLTDICSPGYTPYLGSCVSVKTIFKTADDAERECAVEGGHLASIHDFSFNNFVTNLLVSSGLNQNAHIGIRDYDSKLTWTDGSMYNFQNWGSMYPNIFFGYCGQLLGTTEFGNVGQWTNIPCETKLPYVCMKPQGVSPMYAPLVCPSMQYFEVTGTVYSPGFPLTVPANTHCEYMLAGEIGTTLSVSFPYFAIDSSSKLSLYDGMSGTLPIAVLSGAMPTGIEFNTTQNIMKLVFDTTIWSYGDGWEASFYTIYPAPTGPTVKPTTVKTTTVKTTTVKTTTTKKPTTTKPTPTTKAMSTVRNSCEPQYLYANVMISSPGYPLGYPMNANCVYYVSGNPGKKLVVDFTYVDTKRDKDYISIRDGPYENSFEIGKLSGGTLQNQLRYVTSTNYVTIVFVTDGTKGGAGWVTTVNMTS